VVDLFCGCGGFSTGLEATGRFNVLLGIDVSEPALETFRLNHGTVEQPAKTIQADLGKMKASAIRSELRAMGVLTGELDVLVGGPPCEGFSQNRAERSEATDMYDFLALKSHATKNWNAAGAVKSSRRKAERVARSHRNDKRNRLFRVLLRAAAVLRPKIVLIENVREILTYKDGAIKKEIVKMLTSIGYAVEIRILNAADFGVPQVRRRAFIVAVRLDVFDGSTESVFPPRTHVPKNEPGRLKGLPGEKGHYVSVWEAIGDLPLPRSAAGTRSRQASVRKVAMSKYRRYARRKGPVFGHAERKLSKSVLARIRFMRPGMRSHDLPPR
jgi:DNA (cytosine-5)-methyltransferase 1